MQFKSMRFVAALSTLLFLAACQTPGSGGGTRPLPPTIGPAAVDAKFWQNEPLTVYFSRHSISAQPSQTYFLNDLYFANPYAFQIQLGYQFPANGIEILENGAPIALMPARANTKSYAVRDPATGQIIRWDYPPPSLAQPRGVPPPDRSSYSLELIETCMGRVQTSGNTCPSPQPIMLLTISPPTRPAGPTHGQTFQYTLVEKGSGTYSGDHATTTVKAIYIEPGQCAIRSLLAQPPTGRAGEAVTASFEAVNCRRVTLKAENDILYDRISPAFADNVVDSRSFVLPKRLTATVTLSARDAMEKGPNSRTATVQVDPCSISPTHAQCPINCTTTPNDPRCPPNCTANPTDPRCRTQCPRTADNPDGEFKTWDTNIYCNFVTTPTKIQGCTFDEAQRTFPPPFGCVYTTVTGTPVGECPSGLPKQNYDLCLSCAGASGGPATREYVVVPDACSLDAAKESAVSARLPRTCQFVGPGMCP